MNRSEFNLLHEAAHLAIEIWRRRSSATPTWRSWKAMIARCTSPSASDFARYGGRGITVCDRWKVFANFFADMGERPDGRTLDRVDNERGYDPSNCRWATPTEQTRNRRTTARTGRLDEIDADQIRWLDAEGETRRDIAQFFEVTEATISRVVNGKIWKAVDRG